MWYAGNMSYTLEILTMDREDADVLMKICFIKKYAFFRELLMYQKCIIRGWCTISRWMTVCNLRTLKPRRVDFTRQQQLLTFFLRGTVWVLLIKYINQF